MKHVILGAGPAGVIAAETIRKHAPADTITLIGDEPDAPYSRMAIPYLLIGNIEEKGTWLRKGASHFADLRIDIVQARASKVDAQGRQVVLDNGQTLAFDKLLIATGSHPVRPPIPGLDLPGVHTCWTLEDARAIAALAKPGAKVLQMGAGFIGCIIMEALQLRGVELSVVEMGDRMVPRMMGPMAGGMIRDWCETQGVKVYTSTKVEAIESADAPQGLVGKIAGALGLGHDHMHLHRLGAVAQQHGVIAQHRELVAARALEGVGPRRCGQRWLAINNRCAVEWRKPPFVRIRDEGVGMLETCVKVACQRGQQTCAAVCPVDVKPQSASARDL